MIDRVPSKRGSKLPCDVCGKLSNTLGRYSENSKWWVCHRCFEKADAIAEKADRWPDDNDFAQLRWVRQSTTSSPESEGVGGRRENTKAD
jgi:hypothetical protein